MINSDITGRNISAFLDSPYRLHNLTDRKFNISSNLGFSNLGNGRHDFIDTYNTKCPKFIDCYNKYDTSVLEKNYADTKYRFKECVNNANKYLLPLHNSGLYKKRQPSYLKFTLQSQTYVTPNQTNLGHRSTLRSKYLELEHLPTILARKSQLKLTDFHLRPMYIGRNHVEPHWINEKTQEQTFQDKEISPIAKHFKCYLPRSLNDDSFRLELPNLLSTETSEFERYSTVKGNGLDAYERNKSKIFPFKKDKHNIINVSELLNQLRMKKMYKKELKQLEQNEVNLNEVNAIQPNKSVRERNKPNTVKSYQFQITETVIDHNELSKNKQKKSEEKTFYNVNTRSGTDKDCIEEIAERPSKKLQENSGEDFGDKIEKKTSKDDTKTGKKTKRKKSRQSYMIDRYLNSVEPLETQSGDQVLGDQNNIDSNKKTTHLDDIEEIKSLEEFSSTKNYVKGSLDTGNTIVIAKQSKTVWNRESNKTNRENSFQSTKPGKMVLKLDESLEEMRNKRRDESEKLEINDEKNCKKNKEKIAIKSPEILFDDNIKSQTENPVVSEDEFYDCRTLLEDQVSRCSSFNVSKPLNTKFTNNVPPNTNYTENVQKGPNTNVTENVQNVPRTLHTSTHVPENIRKMPNTNSNDNLTKEQKGQPLNTVHKSKCKSNQVKDSSTQYDQGTSLIETQASDQERVAKKSNDSKNEHSEENENKILLNDMTNERNIINIGCETNLPDSSERKRTTLCTQTQTTVYNICKTKSETELINDTNETSITCNIANPTCDPVKNVRFKEKDKSIAIQTESNSDINEKAKIVKIQKIVEKVLKREIGERPNVKVCSKEKYQGSSSDGMLLASSTDESCYKIILIKKGKKEDESHSKSKTDIEPYDNIQHRTDSGRNENGKRRKNIETYENSKTRTNNKSYEKSKRRANIEPYDHCVKHTMGYNSEDCTSPLRYQYRSQLMNEKKKERSKSKRRHSEQSSRNGSVCKSCRKGNFKQSNNQNPCHPSDTKQEDELPRIRGNAEIRPQLNQNHARIDLRCRPSKKTCSENRSSPARGKPTELCFSSSENISNKTSSSLMNEIEASLASTIHLSECYEGNTKDKNLAIDEKTSSDSVTFSDCTKTKSLDKGLESSNGNQQSSVKVRKISAKNVKWTRNENKNEMDEIDITLSLSCCSSYHDRKRISPEGINNKTIRSSLNNSQVYGQSDCSGKRKRDIPLTRGGGRKSRMWDQCDTDYLQMRDSKKWYHFCFKP